MRLEISESIQRCAAEMSAYFSHILSRIAEQYATYQPDSFLSVEQQAEELIYAADTSETRRLWEMRRCYVCPYCLREHDSRIACPEYAHGALRPGAIHVQPVPPEIRASARSDPASWPVFEGELCYDTPQELAHTTRSLSPDEALPLSLEQILHGRRYGETVRMPLPTEPPVDKSDDLPDDSALPLDAWNAKVDAVLADVAQGQQRAEETHGHTDHERNGREDAHIPGEALLAFVAHHVRNQRISALEDASDAEVLGLAQEEDA